MKGNGVVSVIVPVYNASAWLQRCIESVCNQNYKSFELILVDDGSTDDSLEICMRYASNDSRVKVIHQHNQGASAARNAGLCACSGEYLTFLDSDDAMCPQLLELAIQALDRADVAVYGWNIIDESTNTQCLEKETSEYINDIDLALRRILERYMALGGGYPWNKVWRLRGIWDNPDEIPRFREDITFFEDLEWVVRMLTCVKSMAVLPLALYDHYVNEQGLTLVPGKEEKRALGYHRAMDGIQRTLTSRPALEQWFRERYYQELINGVIDASRKQQRTLRRYLLEKLVDEYVQILRCPRVSVTVRFRCAILTIPALAGWR